MDARAANPGKEARPQEGASAVPEAAEACLIAAPYV